MRPGKTTPHVENVHFRVMNIKRTLRLILIGFAKLLCCCVGLGGVIFFAATFEVRLAIWHARHTPGTRAAMVPMHGHIIGFAMSLLPCLCFGFVLFVSYLWWRGKLPRNRVQRNSILVKTLMISTLSICSAFVIFGLVQKFDSAWDRNRRLALWNIQFTAGKFSCNSFERVLFVAELEKISHVFNNCEILTAKPPLGQITGRMILSVHDQDYSLDIRQYGEQEKLYCWEGKVFRSEELDCLIHEICKGIKTLRESNGMQTVGPATSVSTTD